MAGGFSESKFQSIVQRIQYFNRDWVLPLDGNFDPKKRLYIEFIFDAQLQSQISSGTNLLDFEPIRVNPHDEIHNMLSSGKLPDSLVSDKSLLDSIVTGILATMEEEEKGGLGVIPLRVYIITVKELTSQELCVCPLCLKDIEDGEEEVPECGHGYHQECIFKWLEDNDNCPMCGFEIDLEAY